MSVATEAAAPVAAPRPHELARDALGLPAVLFCIVTGAAPLAAMMFNVPVAVSGGGYAVPAAFLLATIADDLLHRLHRDGAPRHVDRGLLHVHLARPGQRA